MNDSNEMRLAVGQTVYIACRAMIAEQGIRAKKGRVTHFIPAGGNEKETAMIDEVFLLKKNIPMGRFTSEYIFTDPAEANLWAKSQARVMLDEAAQKWEVFQRNCKAVAGEDFL